jgi:DNA-binding transcriptional MerR regulator
VEPHVLRYWEDELKLPIKRNEMGHRYYTGQDIKQLQEIKSLKEQGLQLKAIRTILPRVEDGVEQPIMDRAQRYIVTMSKDKHITLETKPDTAVEFLNNDTDTHAVPERTELKDELCQESETTAAQKSEIAQTTPRATIDVIEQTGEEMAADDEKAQKAARLQYLLQNMITQAVKTANQELCNDVKESILKELDYQFRMQEERDEERWKAEEEHYRKIDEMIRQRHKPKEKPEKGRKKSSILG